MLGKISKIFKNNKSYNFGYIDYFTSGRSRGWAFSKKNKINKVNLYVDKNKIATSNINQKREDIMKLFGTKKFCGFEFFFNRDDIDKFKKGEPRFVVEDENKNEIFELELLSKFKKEKSNDISFSRFFGFDGEIYNLNDQGLLTGWAAARGKENKAISIWLQTKEFNPIEIKCDKWISDLSLHRVSSSSSFEIDINKLPKELSEKSIFFTFDIEGLYHVGLENHIILPKIENGISIESFPNKKIDNEDEIIILKKNLKEFSSLLDSI